MWTSHRKKTLAKLTASDGSRRTSTLKIEDFSSALLRNRKIRRERRQRRFAFQLVSLISGIWGTYNGIYTRQQLDQLRRDLSKVEEQQDRLFAVTSAHQTAILQLDTAVSAILDSTLRHTANPSSVTDVTLQRLVDMLERNVGKAQRAIQAAQLRRLSVDFLTVDQLQDLHPNA